MGAGAGAGAAIGADGAAAAGTRAGRGAAGCAGECAAADCGAGAGAAGAAAAGACGASGSSTDDVPHPITTAISMSPRVSSRSFGIAASRRVFVVMFISLSSCIRLRPVGRFWPSHKYRRTRCRVCSAGHALHPNLVSTRRHQMVRQAHHERYTRSRKHPQRLNREKRKGRTFRPPQMCELIVGMSDNQTSDAGLNFTRVTSSETSSKMASTGMSISASSISQSMRFEGIRGPSLSWMIA